MPLRRRGWYMPTDGEAGAYVSVSEAGRHGISVLANGTLLDGIGPRVRLAVDSAVLGLTKELGDKPSTPSWTQPLGAGIYEIAIRLINDAHSSTKDRNLVVGQLSEWASSATSGDTEGAAREPADGWGGP